MEIYRQSHLVDSPIGVVVVVHGYAEHSGRYQTLIRALQAAHYSVFTYDHPGHGRSEGVRSRVDVGTLLRTLSQVRAQAQALAEEKRVPLFLFGHSMGGLLVIMSALLDPVGVRAIAVTGPALRPLPQVPNFVVTVALALARLVPGLPIASLNPKLVNSDPIKVDEYLNDPLNYTGMVPILTAATMSRQSALTRAQAPYLQVPGLFIVGECDGLADPQAVAEFAEQAGSAVNSQPQAQFVSYPGAFHEVLNEEVGPHVQAQIIDYFAKI